MKLVLELSDVTTSLSENPVYSELKAGSTSVFLFGFSRNENSVLIFSHGQHFRYRDCVRSF